MRIATATVRRQNCNSQELTGTKLNPTKARVIGRAANRSSNNICKLFNNWLAAIQERNNKFLIPSNEPIGEFSMNLIQISSVAADSVKDNELQIVARWKDTDKRPISKENRVRAVILPATIWSNAVSIAATGDDAATPMLRLHLLDSIEELAKQYLSTICEESNWQRTQVPQEAFSLSALLTWQQERAALSGRLNGDEIKQWLSSSATISAVATKHGAEIAKALGEQLVKLASPNHGLTPEKASKILANIWQAADADSNTGLRVQLRLTAIRDKSNDSANVLDSIL